MKIKIFSGRVSEVEKTLNVWLQIPGNRIIKIHDPTSAIYVDPGDHSGTVNIAVLIEFEPS